MRVDSAQGSPREFSIALRMELAKALSSYLARGETERERLRGVTQRVCAEAHRLQLSPEGMVTALKRLFETTPLAGGIDPERRHVALEEFMKSCIAAYFDADEGE
jgi:hypothetical protein